MTQMVVNTVGGKRPPLAALPLWCLRHHLSPASRWHNKAPNSGNLISSSKHSAAKTSPTGVHSEVEGSFGNTGKHVTLT